MSDIIKDEGQASNPGSSNESHLTKDGKPDHRFKKVIRPVRRAPGGS